MANILTDLEVHEVSLVPKAANERRFLILKTANGTTADTDEGGDTVAFEPTPATGGDVAPDLSDAEYNAALEQKIRSLQTQIETSDRMWFNGHHGADIVANEQRKELAKLISHYNDRQGLQQMIDRERERQQYTEAEIDRLLGRS